MALPVYATLTPEQRRTYGPFAAAPDEFSTRTRVYQTPFIYDNVEIGNFYEIDVMKGVEFKADDGFLTIAEDDPIVAVTVVGSGCVPRGYNTVEWWDEGESIANVDNRTVKRLRVDGLNGVHPSIWIHVLAKVAFARGVQYDNVSPGDIRDDYDLLSKLTHGFCGDLPLSFHENSAHFALGQVPVAAGRQAYEALGHSFADLPAGRVPLAYPRRITIRCGCKGTEDAGTKLERYPADYAIRLVQVHLRAAEGRGH